MRIGINVFLSVCKLSKDILTHGDTFAQACSYGSMGATQSINYHRALSQGKGKTKVLQVLYHQRIYAEWRYFDIQNAFDDEMEAFSLTAETL